MNPHEVLGLPAGTFERSAIRKAYAAKVREHPPDDDPAGFREVRDAYEFLIAVAAARERGEVDVSTAVQLPDRGGAPVPEASQGGDHVTGAASPRTEPRGPPIGADWADRLARAREAPEGAGREKALIEAVAAIGREAVARPERFEEWESVVADAFRPRVEPLAEAVTPEVAVEALRHGVFEIAEIAIAAWVGRRPERLVGLSRLVVTVPSPIGSPAAVPVLVGLARRTGLRDAALAKRVADLAYRLAPPEVRTRLEIEIVDALATIGRETYPLSPPALAALERIVEHGFDGPFTDPGVRSLMNVVARLPLDTATVALLSGRAPALLAQVRRDSGPAPARSPGPGAAAAASSRPRSRPPLKPKRAPATWPWIVAALMAWRGIAALGGKSSTDRQLERSLENLRRAEFPPISKFEDFDQQMVLRMGKPGGLDDPLVKAWLAKVRKREVHPYFETPKDDEMLRRLAKPGALDDLEIREWLNVAYYRYSFGGARPRSDPSMR